MPMQSIFSAGEFWIQFFSYIVSFLFAVLVIGFIQPGFLFKFVKVRLSFGRLLMVKIRAVNRDYHKIGKIMDGFLYFSHEKGGKRMNVPDNSVLYRCMGVTWIDVEESSNAIVKADFSTVTGFDAAKHDSLYKRCLYRPSTSDNREKVVLALIVATLIVAAVAGWMGFLSLQESTTAIQAINSLKSGLVVAT